MGDLSVKSAVQTATQRDVASGATPNLAQQLEATDECSRMLTNVADVRSFVIEVHGVVII